MDRKSAFFIAGVAVLLLALVSPLDALGDEYLLSAHVAQHFLLALVVPPLLVLGATDRLRRRLPAMPRWFRNARIAWPLGVGCMLVWHVPAFFNAALASEPLHIAQHLSFLATGVIFWWPVLQPDPARRPSPWAAIGYLFSACTACSLLGAALTFGPTGAYSAYLHPADTLGVLPLIRNQWGIDVKSDQQLAGMLMWVPGCFVYLSAILVRVGEFYRKEELDQPVEAAW
jgi:cytochrome c oxidase assembly factor CtaG